MTSATLLPPRGSAPSLCHLGVQGQHQQWGSHRGPRVLSQRREPPALSVLLPSPHHVLFSRTLQTFRWKCLFSCHPGTCDGSPLLGNVPSAFCALSGWWPKFALAAVFGTGSWRILVPLLHAAGRSQPSRSLSEQATPPRAGLTVPCGDGHPLSVQGSTGGSRVRITQREARTPWWGPVCRQNGLPRPSPEDSLSPAGPAQGQERMEVRPATPGGEGSAAARTHMQRARGSEYLSDTVLFRQLMVSESLEPKSRPLNLF